MTKKKNEEVQEPVGAGVDPSATATPENVSSPEVKVEPTATPVVTETVDTSKMQSQIENLNTALRQERETSKATAVRLEEELSSSKETIDKLKDVFSPEPIEEMQQEALTVEQVEALLEERDQKRKDETRQEEQRRQIKKEVEELSSEWNGADGKPKYDDDDVIKWQQDNGKLYLSPKEAFSMMSRDAIIDWEVKNRVNKAPHVENVETPGGIPQSREPQETKPSSTGELRNAVLEAMENVSDENIN